MFFTIFSVYFPPQLTVEFAARILGRLSAVFGGATGRSVGKLVRAAERLRVGDGVAVAGWQCVDSVGFVIAVILSGDKSKNG
jgi:hypothetical protein